MIKFNQMKSVLRRVLMLMVLLSASLSVFSQIPYFAGTAGDQNLYGYTSLKVRPGINSQETYTTVQYGIGNKFAVGTDLYTGTGYEAIGYLVRANAISSKYFNLGGQVTASFCLNDNHKYDYTTAALYANGAITNDGNLFWVSNTWWGINRGHTENSITNWWYLGYAIKAGKNDYITPMAGLIHSWKFNEDATMAVGFYYTHKKCNFYLWSDKLTEKNPRLIVGLDWKFNCK